MAYDNEEFSSDYSGRYGKTSDFSTTLISNDGRFFGIKLSQDTASQLSTFYPALLDWARRQGERISVPAAKNFATKILGAGEHEATKFAGKAGNAIGYGVILSKQIFDVGGHVYDALNSLNDLRRAVKPLHDAGVANTAPLSGNNEVVSNARSKIRNLFWNKLVHTAVGTIAISPALYGKITEQKTLNQKRAEQLEFERIKGDEKALAVFLESEAGIKAGTLDNDVHVKKLELAIEGRRKAYFAKYEAFKTEHVRIVEEETKKILQLTPENIRQKLAVLQNHGIETRHFQQALKRVGRNTDNIKTVIEEFNREIQIALPDIVEEKIKARFVKQHGAFDHEWAEYLGSDRHSRRPLTIQESMQQKYSQLEEGARKSLDEDEGYGYRGHQRRDQQTSEIAKMAAGLGAGIVAELFGNKLVGNKLKKYSDPIALDRILHLRRALEQSQGEPPELIPDLSGRNDMGYVRYVHEIFQEHQNDCSRPAIGGRFIESFEKSRWDDTAIWQLKDEELTPYEYAVKTIAKRIKDKQMDTIALIDLVGSPKSKVVRANGRSFGPLGVSQDDEKLKVALKKLVDDKSIKLRVEEKQTKEQINEKLADFTFSTDDLKKVLKSKDVNPEERTFIFAMFNDVFGNDGQVLSKLEISKEEAERLGKESNAEFTRHLDNGVALLNEILEQEPETLAKLITDKQKQLILSLKDGIADGKHVEDLMESREERHAIETTIANAMMAIQPNQNKTGFWQRLITAEQQPSRQSKSEREVVRRKRGQEPSEEILGV